MTQKQLCIKFGVNSKAKHLNFILCQKMLGISGKRKATAEMEAAGIIFRTITVDKNGRPTEAMPFKSFEFDELINSSWDVSTVREDFVDLKLMIFVFKEIDGVITFETIHFWNAPFPFKIILILHKTFFLVNVHPNSTPALPGQARERGGISILFLQGSSLPQEHPVSCPQQQWQLPSGQPMHFTPRLLALTR